MTNEHKKTAAIILKGCGIAYDKLSAKTVGFSDLARADCVFVKVHGGRAADGIYAAFDFAKATAKDHGFRLQF